MQDPLPWLRLQLTPGLGRHAQFQLLTHFDSPQAALDAIPSGPEGPPGTPGSSGRQHGRPITSVRKIDTSGLTGQFADVEVLRE